MSEKTHHTEKTHRTGNFRYDSKSIFLTYAQCDATKEALLQKLKAAAKAPNQLKKACIGRETHEDGNYHLHACAWYTQRLTFRSADYMDLEYEGKTFHPNVKDKQVKSKKKALGYCAKEDPEPLCYNMDIKAETAARESHKKLIS